MVRVAGVPVAARMYRADSDRLRPSADRIKYIFAAKWAAGKNHLIGPHKGIGSLTYN